ncbi:MAG TPA: glutamine amidotransferase [Vicinamibacterales bacterium]|nr:glutamine amidotransferase [Vicinamibacterales bacterium]
MLDSLFRLLFGYRPVFFQQGEFRFVPSAGAYIAALVVLAAIAATVLTYRAARGRGSTARHKLVLGTLRVAALALILFCLFRPVLVVKAAVAQQNFLAVLVDDSRSMQIADWNGKARGEFIRQEFTGEGGGVAQALADRFVIRTFRFSSSANRLAAPEELTFGGSQTKLGAALDQVRQELAGLPLAGVVLVSDGADTTDASLSDALLNLKAASVPVFTVGVGQERLAKDIQVSRVNVPRAALKGTSLLVDTVITQSGYAGETVSIDVEDEGRIVGSQEVRLPADGETAAVRVRFTASDPGARRLRFRIAPRAGELVAQNNVREALLDVRDRREKVLYFEGEPRFEYKFIRRAVAEDANLQVVGLQRTADNKYYRQELDNPEQLVSGFPRTRDELFGYRGLILGSVEAGAFTGDQLRMIAEFVERRGGGLLVLGGGRSFAEGSWAGTPVADVLPVVLGRPQGSPQDAPVVTRLKVHPTRAGAAHAVTQLAATEQASAARWNTMPALSSVNALGAIKPGATVLLSGTDERRREQLVLAYQRYGRGKALAFPIQDSWLWQMHVSMAVEDMTHENYWRQLLRWLVDGVPEHVEVHTATERVEAGETVAVTASVVDPTFVEINDARVVAHVTGPKGAFDVPLQWTGEKSGQYRGTFVAADEGAYGAQVEAARGEKPLGTGAVQLRAAPGDAEYFDATMQQARLRRIAEETGGRFYNAAHMAALPEDLSYSGRGITTVEERDLWNMPIVLALLLGLVCAEWSYRRVVGLA